MSDLRTLQGNVTIADTLGGFEISIARQPNAGGYIFELVLLAIHAVIAFPLLGFLIVEGAFEYLHGILAVVVAALAVGALGFLFYRKFRESLEFIYDREVIEIDNQAVRIVQSSARFRDSRDFQAEDIKSINLLFPDNPKLNWLRSLPGVSSRNVDSLRLYTFRGLRRIHTFGRGIEQDEARQILDAIWRRYPQYKG